MYATRTTESCEFCGTPAKECASRGVPAGAGRCCSRCRPGHHAHRERVVEHVEIAEPKPAPPPTSTPSEVHDRADEDRLVAAVLEVAAEDDAAGGRVEEYADRPGVSAYRSLARSRGLGLETVVRAAVRGELRGVVEMPVVTDRNTGPGNRRAGQYQ